MSQLIQAGLPCFECGSSDAMAEYEKNHYCFSCHQSWPKHDLVYTVDTHSVEVEGLELPKGYTQNIPSGILSWLTACGITSALIKKYSIGYTSNFLYKSARFGHEVSCGPRLILPYIENGTLLHYSARGFGGGAKYLYVGGGENKLFKSFSEDKVPRVVIVEDIISAIRVGEVVPCIALGGTLIPDSLIDALPSLADSVTLWLDSDLAGRLGRNKIYRKLNWFCETNHVATKYDPKYYSKKQITNILQGGSDVASIERTSR